MSFNYLLFIYKTITLNFGDSQSKQDDLFVWKENCPADVDGHAASLGWQLVFKWKINYSQSVKAGTSSSKGSARLLKTLHTMKSLSGRRNEWGETRNVLSPWKLQLPCKPCSLTLRGKGSMPCRSAEECHSCNNGDSPTDPKQTVSPWQWGLTLGSCSHSPQSVLSLPAFKPWDISAKMRGWGWSESWLLPTAWMPVGYFTLQHCWSPGTSSSLLSGQLLSHWVLLLGA